MRNKTNELITSLSDNNIDILCLNETFLNSDIQIQHYHSLYKHRKTAGGGVGILIKNNINYTKEEFHCCKKCDDEHISISLIINDKPSLISTIYSPSGKICKSLIKNLNSSKFLNRIICGDLNSKNIIWSSSTTNSNGEKLHNIINNNNLCWGPNKENTYIYHTVLVNWMFWIYSFLINMHIILLQTIKS